MLVVVSQDLGTGGEYRCLCAEGFSGVDCEEDMKAIERAKQQGTCTFNAMPQSMVEQNALL